MATSLSFYRRIEDRYNLGNQIFEFCNKLVEDPTNPSLHVEPIKDAADKRVRTARVNRKYRAVLFELHDGNDTMFVLIDILNHDDAYALATSKTLVVNEVSGVPALVDATAPEVAVAMSQAEIESRAKRLAAEQLAAEAAAAAATDSSAAPMQEDAPSADAADDGEDVRPWDAVGVAKHELTDELGLSPQTVALLEQADSVEDLESSLVTAPSWEHDAVLGLLSGMSIAEVREDLGLVEPAMADTSSDKALVDGIKSPAARMDFAIDPGEEELAAILTSSFAEWRVFLHPSQRRAVEAEHSGSARITGGAGTGKTVVVVHRTKHLLQKNPRARVFLTTYTRELANALKTQMNELYPTFPEASVHGAPGLWISGVDALVFDVLSNAQATERAAAMAAVLNIDADFVPRGLEGVEEKRQWQEAAELKGSSLPREKSHPTFLAQEYSAVILTQGITDEKTYLRARRTGRGTPLNRAERKAVWAIVEYFHAACASIEKLTYAAAAAVAAHIVEHRTGTEGMFDHVLIDEAQDFHAGHWKFLRAVAKRGPNDIFIAEDSHQRIYGQRLVLRNYGIETRGRASTKLRVNYRTTRQNLGYATAILEGTEWVDSEEDQDDLHGYHSVRRGPAPVVLNSESKAEEAEALAARIQDWASGEEDVSIGVLTRTNARKDEIATQLGELGVAVSTGRRTSRERPVAVMTMHNAKGLEFTHVVLLDVSREALPQRYLMKGLAPAEADEALQRERALLYVAASRARDVLLVSVVGEASELLPG
ncbi:3'-5' exonuclease [Corynebacterium minutissimum]|uniref:DNA 3'-5' helicase n=1 Tax=Corynebacterium minutissimum TaxID=38301 RepID=A0A2X4UR94_9CORY|nr:3'-5' exonuclease [Corynebacterium minutissimum]KHO30051.1 hypothetical protein NX84_04240 [Corynebacterium minutissimum]QPS60536.1 DEAD/DEAH box helicase [Corynebacterium minutissimum]QQA78676.1 DEAD/DEAH box helicase [Corynebacterium minutissimum]SQI00604.1 putative helicase [Corynebacterium minutissimum]VEG05328.1 putative helicase [Corynebacterium minutissimum]